LAETYPAPTEDAGLDYLADEGETVSALQNITRFFGCDTNA
jgi:hypothetical protein